MATYYLQDMAIHSAIALGEEGPRDLWVPDICMPAESDRPIEEYILLGSVPGFEKWEGRRRRERIRQAKILVVNEDYDATLAIPKNDLRRGKGAALNLLINRFWAKSEIHWRKLVTTLIEDGETGLAYDGKAFFATDHEWGDSGSQSNLLTINIANYPADVHGTAALPSIEEAAFVMMDIINALLGLVDDKAEPMNEDMQKVLIMTPTPLTGIFRTAATAETFGPGKPNPLKGMVDEIRVAGNPRLTWTTDICGFRADAQNFPFIKQSLDEVEQEYLGLDSEHCKKEKEVLYIVDASRQVAYLDPRVAIKVKMTVS